MEKGSHLLCAIEAPMTPPSEILSIAYLSGLNQATAFKPFKCQCPSLHNTAAKTHSGANTWQIKYMDLDALLTPDEKRFHRSEKSFFWPNVALLFSPNETR